MTTQPPGNDADRTPPHLQNAGTMLATWLTRTPGMELSGVVQEVTTRDGRITSLGPSHTYRIGALVGQGGQAAVAAATPIGIPDRGPLVARVERSPGDPREWRRRELLLFLAHLSRVTPATYPALIRTTESFVTYAHSSDLHGQAMFDSHAGNEPLWVDVMERCTTLADHMKATHPNGYDPLEGAKLAVPLLRTLGVLHDQYRLVHRDIDEGNVLVAPDATLRIADWGVVVPMSGQKDYTYTVAFGKRTTMPPETRDGDQKVGHHTDAWQAGRLLGLILTGTSPFLNDGTTLNSPRLAALPKELRAVIEGLTNPHVGARLGTYDAATLLEEFIGYPVTPTARTPQSLRGKALIGVTTLALLGGIGTIAAMNWPDGPATAGTTPTPLTTNSPTLTSTGSPLTTEVTTSPTTTSTVEPVAVTDGHLREFASPSGVVCDLGAAEGNEDFTADTPVAGCHVPYPSYPAFEITDEGLVDVTCPEALVVAIPYPSDYGMGCVTREESEAAVLAAGSTNSYGGFRCTVEDDVIECTVDDDSGNGFRVGNSEFNIIEHQRMLSLVYTEPVSPGGTPVWELSSEGANPVTVPLMDSFYDFDPHTRRVLYAVNMGVNLAITDLDDYSTETVLNDNVFEALWAPGFEDIAYISNDNELRWRSLDGEDRLLAADVGPNWSISPQGDAVAFTRGSRGGGFLRDAANVGLFIASVKDGSVIRVSDVDRSDTAALVQPIWSPDGDWVALSYYDEATSRWLVSLARADGTGARDLQLSSSLAAEPWASTCFLDSSPLLWSPGGQFAGISCAVEGVIPHPLVVYQIDPETATLTSGAIFGPVGDLIGWDIPGESVWVYPTNLTTTPQRWKVS